MTDLELQQELSQLFQESSQTYWQHFDATQDDNDLWSYWYATHLHDPLSHLLDARIDFADLVQLLLLVDKIRQLQAPHIRCSDYFTQFFIHCYLNDKHTLTSPLLTSENIMKSSNSPLDTD